MQTILKAISKLLSDHSIRNSYIKEQQPHVLILIRPFGATIIQNDDNIEIFMIEPPSDPDNFLHAKLNVANPDLISEIIKLIT
jgi:hypothetical protein